MRPGNFSTSKHYRSLNKPARLSRVDDRTVNVRRFSNPLRAVEKTAIFFKPLRSPRDFCHIADKGGMREPRRFHLIPRHC